MIIETLFDEQQPVTYMDGGDPVPAIILNVKYNNGVKYDIWLWITKEMKSDIPENELQP